MTHDGLFGFYEFQTMNKKIEDSTCYLYCALSSHEAEKKLLPTPRSPPV
jgi:hypothetical protein